MTLKEQPVLQVYTRSSSGVRLFLRSVSQNIVDKALQDE
jgi:hypothetical protein